MTDVIEAGPPAAGLGGQEGASARQFQPIEFRGKTSEYFGVWIVNLVLTLLTLGVWSAWAKVRRLRYFYGNTRLDGAHFEYLASPWALLKGRLIVVAVIGVYYVAGLVHPLAQPAALVLFLPFYPWIVNKSLSFSARVTRHRNVRFHWRGTYWQTLVYSLLLPVAGLLTLGGVLPLATREWQRYFIGNLSFGAAPFRSEARIGLFYRAFFAALGVFLLGFILLIGLIVGIGAVAVASSPNLSEIFREPRSAGFIAAVIVAIVAYILLLLVLVFATGIYSARTRNAAVSAMTLEGGYRFDSTLSGMRLGWITVSNLLAILFTLGLMTPWASIRMWRYQCDNFLVAPGPDPHIFVDAQAEAGGAFGEEFADIEGFEIGL